MRYALIGCEVLFRECCLAAAASPATIDMVMLPQGLHNTPPDLRSRVQQEIDRLDGEMAASQPAYDALLIGYAICSNGAVGLTARRAPLVIPRGHDCMTLLLGSKESYQNYFDNHAGVYWYSSGWIERTLQPGRARYEQAYHRYVEQYGEDNADYLMDMEQGWYKGYNWANYINWDLPTAERDRQFTRECAEYLGWNYDEVHGDRRLLYDLFAGRWDEDRFLLVPPGSCIEPIYDGTIMKACAGCACHGAEQCAQTAGPAPLNR